MPSSRRFGQLLLALAAALPGNTACRRPLDSGQSATSSNSGLVGVWRATVVAVRGSNSTTTNTSPPASLFIITRSHYSQIFEMGDVGRADFAAARPTDAEKIVAFDAFAANAGTYQVRGNMLILQPLVAKRPRPTAGYSTIPHEFTIRGDTLFTVDRGYSGSGPREFRVTWNRID